MEGEEFEEEAVVVGEVPTVTVPRHIKKRSLKNKALTVDFNDKELRDFVTGFHKRKKKRRKEAERQLQEKERLKRIEARKKRKQERELVMYGGVLPSERPDDANNDCEQDDEPNTNASASETKTYEAGITTITVTTSELSHEDDLGPASFIPKPSCKAEKNQSLAVKKKPLKRVIKRKSHRKGGKKPAFKKKNKRKNKNKR